MSDKTCGESVSDGIWNRKPCANPAKVERNGKFYCGVHDPVRLAKLRSKQDAIYADRFEARNKKHQIERAAPELLAALQALDDACCADLEDRENRITFRKALISGRVAIAKALGETT